MGVEIVYLSIQNHKLNAIIKDPKKYFQTLSEDQVVPSFTAQDIYGNDVSMRYSPTEPHTMLFWFAPTCPSCEDNIVFWKLIHSEYSSEMLRFLAMYAGNPDEAKEFVAEHDVKFPVICANNRFIVDSYKGHVLPQTMLIAPEGIIDGVWPGVLDGKKQDAIIALLEKLNP